MSVSEAGKKILDGLKDAAAANWSRVTIDGVTWVRKFPSTVTDDFESFVAQMPLCPASGEALPTYERRALQIIKLATEQAEEIRALHIRK